MTVLTVRNLDVTFDTGEERVEAVRDLAFSVDTRETLGIVGESGSGKSQAMLAILGLLAPNGRASGSARLGETELVNASPDTLRAVRGRRVGVVFQDPMQSLNPYLTIGRQLDLVLRRHRSLPARQRRAEIVAMLDAVRIPEPERRLAAYPHEFSGGMRQRVLIAMALLSRPEVLIADEPTTALDVTVQAGILALLTELRDAFGMAMILISHDLGVIAGTCESLLVMENGRGVEAGPIRDLFVRPAHACTRRLLAGVPRLDEPGRAPLAERSHRLLDVDSLTIRYPLVRTGAWRRRWFEAVRDVSLSLAGGETLGVVGESGSGKSSLARAVLSMLPAVTGDVRLTAADGAPLRPGRDIQMVFQDPLASLNPRMRVEAIVGEPLGIHEPRLGSIERHRRVGEMLERVGLDTSHARRFPHEFSGGQCQRIGIARALITQPALVICDEAVSSLDVTVQADIVELLLDLQRERGLAMLFIAHDLAVVRRMSHRLIVMYLGRIVESGPADAIYRAPSHPYTRALLDAAPLPDPEVERNRARDGTAIDVPSPWNPPSGCAYRTRCAFATEVCATTIPALDGATNVVAAACHRVGELPPWPSSD